MSHSFNKIWIHAIWSTKNREKIISSELETLLYKFIYHQFKELGCTLKTIDGISDHVHCLFLLNPQKSIADVIKQIKGSSSHYINQQNLINNKFSWQTGYGAFSISESSLDKVHDYIKNQKQHHAKKTFQQEYESFLNIYGFSDTKEF